MYEFKPILMGNFGPVAVSRRLREIHKRIDELEEMLSGKAVNETVDSAETVILEDSKEEESFDWKTCDDAQALKAYALEKHGLSIKGNKKAETVREEIEAFIAG